MKININGPIIPDSYAWIYDYFEEPYASPKKVIEALSENESENVTVIINSGGGSVYAASEIYHALKSHKGKVVAEIASIAASAASFLAMGADEVAIAPTGQIMIHNASSYAGGDYREMDKASAMLKAVNASISKAYELKTNQSKDEIKAMMDDETYLTADTAVEKGFADRILFISEEHDFVADEGTLLPKAVIDDMMKRMENGEFENKEKSTINGVDNEKGDEEEMNYDDLKNNHPELFNKIKNEGREEGIKEENKRIQNIDEIAQVGMEELIHNAKYKEPLNAGELAIAILNKQKEVGAQHVKNVEDDAKELDQVEAKAADEEEEQKEKELVVASKNLKGLFAEGGVL